MNAVKISVLVFVLLTAVLFTALFFLLLSFITKDVKRAAILVTFYAFLFFAYGRLYDIAPVLSIAGLVIGRHKYLITLYALLTIAGTLWILRSSCCKKYVDQVAIFLNMFSLGLILVVVVVATYNFDWITFESKKHIESKNLIGKQQVRQDSQSGGKIPRPNVYFIIFDGYASNRVLKKYYDWDDSGVVGALRTRGFSVNENACSNYPFTILSIGATLNMRYVHEDRGFIDAKSKALYLRQIIEHNKVMERFKSEGYEVVSNIGGNAFSNDIHGRFNGHKLFSSSDGFVELVVNVSILRIIEYLWIADAKRQEILSVLEDWKLFDIPKKPTFVYTHVICPHLPHFFNADGSKPDFFETTLKRADWKSYNKESYTEQTKFIGKQMVEIADSLTHRDPSAFIVMQADHGLLLFANLSDYNKRPPLEFLDAQYGILNAIYSPPSIIMPGKITPVNLFRCVFNALFDAKLEVLPDRAFYTTKKEPYEIYDVTDDLNHLMN
ncbi:MAG: hypothetical protein ACLQBC_18185 [Syntrophales bacterium]